MAVLRILLPLLMMLLPVLAPAVPEGQERRASEKLAMAFAGNRMGELFQAFDAPLQEKIPNAKLMEMRRSLDESGGAFVRVQAARESPLSPGRRQVAVPLDFENLSAELLFTWHALEGDARLVGFSVAPRRREQSSKIVRPGTVPFIDASYVDVEKFQQFRVELSGAGEPIEATIVMPVWKSAGMVSPGIVMIGDSEMYGEDGEIGPNRPLRDMALGLGSMGVASIRFAQRRDQQDGFDSTVYTVDEELLVDAVAAVRTLAGTGGIDRWRVFVMGVGNGGWLAPEVARRVPGVAGIIAVGPPTQYNAPAHLDRLQRAGAVGAEVDPREWAVIQGALPFLETGGLNRDHRLHDRPASYWYSVAPLRPLEVLASHKKPVLLVFGGRDPLLGEAETAVWRELREKNRNIAIDYHPLLNRWLMPQRSGAPDDANQPAHVDRGALQKLAEFVKK